jgi:hypothetical protein
MTFEFSRQYLEKYPYIKLHESPSSGNRGVPYGLTWQTNGRFSQFCKLTKQTVRVHKWEQLALCLLVTRHIPIVLKHRHSCTYKSFCTINEAYLIMQICIRCLTLLACEEHLKYYFISHKSSVSCCCLYYWFVVDVVQNITNSLTIKV